MAKNNCIALVACVAMGSVTALEIVAMLTGKDGAFFNVTMGAILALAAGAGVKVAFLRDTKES